MSGGGLCFSPSLTWYSRSQASRSAGGIRPFTFHVPQNTLKNQRHTKIHIQHWKITTFLTILLISALITTGALSQSILSFRKTRFYNRWGHISTYLSCSIILRTTCMYISIGVAMIADNSTACSTRQDTRTRNYWESEEFQTKIHHSESMYITGLLAIPILHVYSHRLR